MGGFVLQICESLPLVGSEVRNGKTVEDHLLDPIWDQYWRERLSKRSTLLPRAFRAQMKCSFLEGIFIVFGWKGWPSYERNIMGSWRPDSPSFSLASDDRMTRDRMAVA
jgi:hypothetical protein